MFDQCTNMRQFPESRDTDKIRTLTPHVVCMACSSEIAPLRHEFFDLPLFLFPWGFHSKACFVMLLFVFLSVYPVLSNVIVLILLLS